jgi:hypothetical protein
MTTAGRTTDPTLLIRLQGERDVEVSDMTAA